MANTTRLTLPLVAAAQAQEHVTHNEALKLLDAIVQAGVIDKDLTSPPGSPSEGDTYIVGGSATGAWNGRDNNLTIYQNGAWTFVAPLNGWIAWVSDESTLYIFNSGAWASFSATVFAREVLTANRTYYVDDALGSDTNNGLGSGTGAFATLQKAADVVFGTLDLGGHNVTISVADGTYTAGVNQTSPQVGAGVVLFRGNTTTPANCIVSITNGTCFQAIGAGTKFTIDGFQLSTTSSGNCVSTNFQGSITIHPNMDFSSCATRHLAPAAGGVIEISSGYTISGGAQQHIHASQGGLVFSNGDTFTLVGTPAFNNFANASVCASIRITSATFAGSGATGQRYQATLNGVINTGGGGASYLPGDVAGATGSGGQYV